MKGAATMRTITAIAVFLFGTTFLWLAPAMAGKSGSDLGGARWVAVQLLVWASIIGFAVSAWGIYRSQTWWVPALAASAVAGVAATAVYGVAVRDVAGVANVASNVVIHAGISLALLVAVATPSPAPHLRRTPLTATGVRKGLESHRPAWLLTARSRQPRGYAVGAVHVRGIPTPAAYRRPTEKRCQEAGPGS